MEVQLCGDLAVLGPAGVVDPAGFGGRRARLAFAVLVLERAAPIGRAQLAEVLWPTDLPPTWESAVRSTLSRVRAVLRDGGLTGDPIATGSGTVHLRADDLDVDVERAAADVDAAERRLGHDAAGARDAAARAVDVLARPFLPGLDGAWVDEQRRHLHLLHRRGRDALAAALLATGEPARAVDVAERTLELEPLHEPAHRAVMRGHADNGNRAAALRAYTRCRAVLVEELGVDPSPETEQAYLDLLLLEGPALDRAERPALPSALRPRDELPLAGRDDQLAALVQWWQRTGSTSGGVVLVAGEAGIGKSRLARELTAIAHRTGALVLHGRCDADERVPFQPFAEALAGGPAGASDPLLEAERADVFDALVAWFAGAAAAQPVLLVLDDLQWAGEDTLAALAHVVRHADGAPVAVVLTHRDETGGAGSPAPLLAGLVRDERLLRVELDALDGSAVATILEQVGGAPLDDDGLVAASALHRVTAGNPFFVGETLRHRLDTGALACVDGRWTSRPGADGGDEVAPGVRDVVIARLQGLGPDALDTLTLGAVIGPEFELALLGDCVDGGLERAVDVVDRAILARVIRARADRPGRCRFVHAVVPQTLLARLTEPRRCRLHATVAAAIAARPDHPDRAAQLAWHLVEAAPFGEVEPAVAHSIEAARRAAASVAYDTAAGFLRRALELPVGPTDRADLLVELGTIGARAQASEEAHAAFLEALDLARGFDDATRLARAALGASTGWRGASEWFPEPLRRDLVHEALAALDRADATGEDDERVELRIRLLGELSLGTSTARERHALGRQAMDLAAAHPSPAVLLAAFGASRVAWWEPEQAATRLAYAERVIDVAARRRDQHLWASLQLHRLGDLLQLGERDAYDETRHALRSSTVVDASRRLRWQLLVFDVTDAMIDGRLADGHRAAGDALAMWGDEPHVDAVQTFGLQTAALHLLEGDLDSATGLIDLALVALPEVLAVRCAHLWLLALAGRDAEARALVAAIADDDFAGIPRDNGFAPSASVVAEALWLLGDAGRADALTALVGGLAGQFTVQPGPSVFLGPADATLALLAATAGDRGRAAAHLDAAVDACHRFRAPWWADRLEARRAELLRP